MECSYFIEIRDRRELNMFGVSTTHQKFLHVKFSQKFCELQKNSIKLTIENKRSFFILACVKYIMLEVILSDCRKSCSEKTIHLLMNEETEEVKKIPN